MVKETGVENLQKLLVEAGAQFDGGSKYTVPTSGLKAVDVVIKVYLGDIHSMGLDYEMQADLIVPSYGSMDTGGKIRIPLSELRLLSEEKRKP